MLGAGAAAVAALFLAVHHPLSPALATALWLAWAMLVFWRPGAWLFVLPAALPWLNFSPWTGWIVFDEFDLLVLGAIAGGYASRMRAAARPDAAPPALPPTGLRWLVLLLGALGLVGLWRGFADAGLAFGWFQAYADPLNSLRIFKPLAGALLLWPLLRQQLQVSTPIALRRFAAGMLCGLCVVSLAVLWERAAFPGLWDFSAPYRSTALFWEMHVGGAAIDAYLALSLPFVAWALYSAKSPLQWLFAAALTVLAVYAGLSTFSRGVYLAAAASMVWLGLGLLARERRVDARLHGWRALALLAAGALTTLALFVVLEAFGRVALVALSGALFLLLVGVGWQRSGWRTAAGLGLALVLALELVLVFGTGNFMATRLSASDRDFGSRLDHWRSGVGLLHGPADGLLGIGLGRLPDRYARGVPGREFSGTLTWVDTASGHQVAKLAGPKALGELGGLFALTQRLPLSLQPEATYRVAFDVRVLEPANLAVSVCEMHQLYPGRCQSAQLGLQPADTAWQPHALTLRGPPLGQGGVPRLRVFALTLLDASDELMFDNLRLTASGPDNLLRNGDFSRELAHWWPAAQSYFVPWHIDNLYLELLIERGLAGLALFMALAGLALHNLVAGPARRRSMAPFLAAAICGGLLVGLVSSVMDVPRVAWLLWFLLLLALSLGDVEEAA